MSITFSNVCVFKEDIIKVETNHLLMLMAATRQQYNEPFCSGVSCGLIQKAGAPDHVKQMDILWFNASVRHQY